jgi:GT2 family glycosyltransferase
MNTLFILQDISAYHSFYEALKNVFFNADVLILTRDDQRDFNRVFKTINPEKYEAVFVFLKAKEIFRQKAAFKKFNNLVILEEDACQNYIPASRFYKSFSDLYKDFPRLKIIVTGRALADRLNEEGFSAYFVSKWFDSARMKNISADRTIKFGFIGKTENVVYSQRKETLEDISSVIPLQQFSTEPDEKYVEALNKIDYFISCDQGLNEYMIKNFEALACGCILATYDQGNYENELLGFQDMVNAILYKTKEELVEKIDLLEADPIKKDGLRKAGYQLAWEKHKAVDAANRIAEVIKQPFHPISSKNLPMQASLIIATYNQAKNLYLILESVKLQTRQNIEVVVADDGSSDDTMSVIENFKRTSDIPISIVTQEDRGFRKTMILNKAIKKSAADYLIFIDGDMLLDKNFIENHLLSRDRNIVLCGHRGVKFSPGYSEKIVKNAILPKMNVINMLFQKLMGNVENPLRSLIIKSAFLRKIAVPYRNNLSGCNFSAYREALDKVNGFNEDVLEHGYNDYELGHRLKLAGYKLVDVSKLCNTFHIYHPTRKTNREEVRKKIQRIEQAVEARCSNGIVK